MNNCPCKDCICVPMCQSKHYADLVFDCSLIWNYLAEPLTPTQRNNGRLGLLQKALNPTTWCLFSDDNGCLCVDNNMKYGNCHFYY